MLRHRKAMSLIEAAAGVNACIQQRSLNASCQRRRKLLARLFSMASHVHRSLNPQSTAGICSHGPRNAQFPDLPQHLLDFAVQMALRILLPRVGVQELLHLRHPAVGLGAEAQLDLHQGLEAGVQVGHAQVNELGQFREELLVEGLVGGAREVGLALGAGQFRRVLVRFLDELLDAGPGGVVVEEFVVAFLDAC